MADRFRGGYRCARPRGSSPTSYTRRSRSTRARRLSVCGLGAPGPRTCSTATPRTTSASAMSWRWQRHGTASAQRTAVGPRRRESEQRVQPGTEFLGIHVIGVGAEGGLAPRHVRRVGSRRSAAAERRQPLVADSGGRERLRQRLAPELRVPARGGKATDVGDDRDAMRLQQREQLLGAACRVPEGVDGHRPRV